MLLINNYLKVINRFNIYVRALIRSTAPKEIFTSYEKLWLCFIMKENYGKIWDNKNWVKF